MKDPTPILVPLTPEAKMGLPGDKIELDSFPFRVGRESRLGLVRGSLEVMERRKLSAPPNNELYLCDEAPVLNVSREHLQIERKENNGYELVDRGSACGTIVGNQVVGGKDAGGRCPLADGNVIVIGTSQSPFVFKFLLQAKSDG